MIEHSAEFRFRRHHQVQEVAARPQRRLETFQGDSKAEINIIYVSWQEKVIGHCVEFQFLRHHHVQEIAARHHRHLEAFLKDLKEQ